MSTVTLPDGSVHSDTNACIAALICWEFIAAGISAIVLRGWLDFIETCERPGTPGWFAFYPLGGEPAWFAGTLYADIDDTALCASVLVAAGRRTRSWAQRLIDSLAPFRRHYISEADRPWIRSGMYQTWLAPNIPRNPVDFCANLNLLTLHALAGRSEKVSGELVQSLASTCRWAGTSDERTRAIAPYYFSARELRYAWRRAAAVGAVDGDLFGLPMPAREDDEPLFGSDDGRFVWRSRALRQFRQTAVGETSGISAPSSPVGDWRGIRPIRIHTTR